TGNIETLGKNRHRIRIFLGFGPDGEPQYHREMFYGSKAEAEKYKTSLLQQIHSGAYVPQNRITLSEFLDQWMREMVKPHLAPKTVETYERAVKHIKKYLGHIQLQKLRSLDIQQYYRMALESGRADGKGG